ncbi:zinc finger protein 91-like [Ctenocephalides felis]|uniref:zinc finger protein 91-like n=1 Tax=Ctenocephalides felis TaxID=7515 RepID=UPI000E6E3984|nr:zinc finger protein 91-like [Ctenocephalides felis]
MNSYYEKSPEDVCKSAVEDLRDDGCFYRNETNQNDTQVSQNYSEDETVNELLSTLKELLESFQDEKLKQEIIDNIYNTVLNARSEYLKMPNPKVNIEPQEFSIEDQDFEIKEEEPEHKETYQERFMKSDLMIENEVNEYSGTCNDLEQHMPVQSHSCTFCSDTFTDSSALEIHQKTHTDEKPFECIICNKAFTGQIDFDQHVCDWEKTLTLNESDEIRQELFEAPHYKCNEGTCNESFTRAHDLEQHMPVHSHSCTFCSDTFADSSALEIHQKMHTDEKPFECTICNKAFAVKLDFDQHVCVGEKTLTLSECDEIRQELFEAPHFKCNEGTCKKSFTGPHDLEQHMLVHCHNCTFCSDTFSDPSTLEIHLKIHAGVKSFVCTICNKAFAVKFDFDQHACDWGKTLILSESDEIRQEFIEAPHYKCNEGTCNELFTEQHMLEHCHSCTFCSDTFPDSGALEIHLKIHTDVKPFVCTICNKAFTGQFDFDQHVCNGEKTLPLGESDEIRQELFEAPHYKCNEGTCKKSFTGPHDLEQHMLVHCHSCTFCSDTFPDSNTLEIHQKMHTDEKPFECTICNKAFPRQLDFDQHVCDWEKTLTLSESDEVRQEFIEAPHYKCNESTCNESFTEQHMLEHCHSCTFCSDTFPDSGALEIHLKIHADVKPFVCTICNKVFTRQLDFDQHVCDWEKTLTLSESDNQKQNLDTQSAKGSHKCKVCDRSLSTIWTLKKHMLVHSGVRPHACKMCNKSFSTKSNLNMHMLVHSGVRSYSCKVCNKTFTYFGSLKSHMSMHNGDLPYKCKVCDKQFAHSRNLKRHMPVHSGERPHRCELCDKTFIHWRNLKTHKLYIHSGHRPHKCKVCGKSFKQPSDLKSHMVTHSDEKPHICEVCSKSFARKSSLKMHMLIHIGTRPHKCKVCNKSFTESGGLKRHMVIHSGEKLYRCKVCDKSFVQRGGLKRHMLVHTGEKLYRCKVCEKSFVQPSDLKSHMLTHSDEKPHICELCSKSFARKSGLKTHMLIHIGTRPHKCKVCGKSFIQSADLKSHMVIHSDEKPHICDVCSKSFARKNGLKTHMLIHIGTRPHKCKVCSKSFIKGDGLKRHMVIHTGEKLYRCKVCDKAFSQRSSLKTHMLVHSGERLHRCKVCEKSFVHRGGLKMHMLIHTGERPYRCTVCDKRFTQVGVLKTHMQIHSNEPRPKCKICEKSFSTKRYLKRHMLVHSSEQFHTCELADK